MYVSVQSECTLLSTKTYIFHVPGTRTKSWHILEGKVVLEEQAQVLQWLVKMSVSKHSEKTFRHTETKDYGVYTQNDVVSVRKAVRRPAIIFISAS